MSSMAPEIDEGEGEGLDVLAVLAEFQTRLTDVELARDIVMVPYAPRICFPFASGYYTVFGSVRRIP